MPNLVALCVCLRLFLVSDDLGVGVPRQKMCRYDAMDESQEHHAKERHTLDNRLLDVLCMIFVPRVLDHLPVNETGTEELCKKE